MTADDTTPFADVCSLLGSWVAPALFLIVAGIVICHDVRAWLRRHRHDLVLVALYLLAVYALWPYLLTHRVGPIDFIAGLWPWLAAHPLRLLAVLPFLVGTVPLLRGPRV